MMFLVVAEAEKGEATGCQLPETGGGEKESPIRLTAKN